MASCVSLLLVGFLVLVAEVGGDEMEVEELLGLFEVMSCFLEDQSWAQDHPQPCTDTPWPGLECEVDQQQDPPIFHVTKLHVGPDVVSPPCKPSANLSASLSKLPFLKTLSVFACFVSPITLSPSLFVSLSSLEHLTLISNPGLSGTIPPSLAQIGALRVLSLSQNSLQGPIPSELGGLVNLEQLDLSYNNFTGSVPSQIGGLKKLTILDLSSNNLEGQVPSNLGQLELLQKVDLSHNRFAQKLPPSLGQLESLLLLDLSNNLLQGPIPETLSGLAQIQYFLADHNPINTNLPLFFGTLHKLTTLSFSSCGLIGPIPSSLSLLNNLTALSLDNNSLTGTIPPSLGWLQNLGQLNLSHNRLEGELMLPEEFVQRLGKRLDVRGNNGLCTSNSLYSKNVTMLLETHSCKQDQEANGTKAWPQDQQQHHPDDNDDDGSKRARPSWGHENASPSSRIGPFLVQVSAVLAICLFLGSSS